MRKEEKKMILRLVPLLCLMLILTIFADNSQATIIDSFSTPQSLTINTVGTVSSSVSSSGGDILGVERDMTLEMLSGSGMAVQADLGGFSILNHAQNASTTGKTTITWDGVDGTPAIDYTGLGGIDLTESGANNGMIISVIFDDLPSEIIVSAYSDAGNWSKYIASLPGMIFSSPAIITMPFANFVSQSGSGADFTNIGAISLVVNGALYGGTDMMLDNVETTNPVPEPSTFALLALGIAGVLFSAKRKNSR